MNDFKIGQRVRAKHDHTFEGEVIYLWNFGDKLDIQSEVGLVTVPALWLEPAPKPLNPLVPWDVLNEVMLMVGYGATFLNKLRELGYGPAEETR